MESLYEKRFFLQIEQRLQMPDFPSQNFTLLLLSIQFGNKGLYIRIISEVIAFYVKAKDKLKAKRPMQLVWQLKYYIYKTMKSNNANKQVNKQIPLISLKNILLTH